MPPSLHPLKVENLANLLPLTVYIFVQVCEPQEKEECREVFDTTPSCNIVNEEKCETIYETGYKEDCTSTKDQELCRDVVRQVTTVNNKHKYLSALEFVVTQSILTYTPLHYRSARRYPERRSVRLCTKRSPPISAAPGRWMSAGKQDC